MVLDLDERSHNLTILEDQGFLDATFNTDYLERVLLPEWKRGNADETV